MAYEVLADPEKRKLYDKYGEEGLRDGPQAQGFSDIFDLFGMGGGRREAGPKKVKPTGAVVEVSLEDLYNGKEAEVKVERHRICTKCNGVGGSDASAVAACKACKGRGMRTVMMQLGPGMYSQRTGPCDECNGRGESMDPTKMCKACQGKKIKKETKTITVEIDKGAPNGEKYVKHGEGDEVPEAEPGDVIVQIKEKKHKTFLRKGADLFMEKEITLIESLTGLDFVLTHLDGRRVRIRNQPGEIITPDQLMTVENLGMPFHKKTYQLGNLIIQFKIKFPATLDPKAVTLLQEALAETKQTTPSNKKKGGKKEEQKEEIAEVCQLKVFEEAHRNTHHRGGTGGHESDEEEDEDGQAHGQRVGC